MRRLTKADLFAANHGPARPGPVPPRVVRQVVAVEAHLRKMQPVLKKVQPVRQKASAMLERLLR